MVSVPHLVRLLHATLRDRPADVEVASGYRRRRSKFTGALFVQTTVLGWLAQPSGSLHALTTVAASLGVRITPQALDQRLGSAGAAMLKAVLESAVSEAVSTEPSTLPIVDRFPAVVVLDSTTITLPNDLESIWVSCGGAPGTAPRSAVKATVRIDLCQGRLDGPVLTDARSQDKASRLQHAAVPPGALRIGDLGFWSLATLQTLRAQQAHFLSRLHVQTVVARADDGTRLDLTAWLGRQQDDQIELEVTLGVTHRVPARLLAIRVSPVVAQQRRRMIRETARRKGTTPSRASLERADWTLLVTSVPQAELSLAEAVVLMRARWQIELLFKLWKSHGQIDDWRSRRASRILCEFYAKLIAMVIQHWIILTGGWSRPDHSMARSATAIRSHATSLALTLHHPSSLRRTLTVIATVLANGTGITKRRSKPSLSQLLADPSLLP